MAMTDPPLTDICVAPRVTFVIFENISLFFNTIDNFIFTFHCLVVWFNLIDALKSAVTHTVDGGR